MEKEQIELPEPGVRDLSGKHFVGYTADQMRAAILQEREFWRQAVEKLLRAGGIEKGLARKIAADVRKGSE